MYLCLKPFLKKNKIFFIRKEKSLIITSIKGLSIEYLLKIPLRYFGKKYIKKSILTIHTKKKKLKQKHNRLRHPGNQNHQQSMVLNLYLLQTLYLMSFDKNKIKVVLKTSFANVY